MAEFNVGGTKIQVDFPRFKSQGVLIGAGVVGVLVGVLTSIYTVKADEEGVVLRFGKYQSTQPPGLHFKMPFFIDKVEKVAVLRQMKQEYGFGTPGNTNRFQWSDASDQEKEKKMVTGDLNAALVEWVIQYQITEPTDWLFRVRDAESTLRNASESVMREVVGDRTVEPWA